MKDDSIILKAYLLFSISVSQFDIRYLCCRHAIMGPCVTGSGVFDLNGVFCL